MSKRRSKPYHRRWHEDALNGYRRLSLELRGAYTTILDVMYDHAGPIRDEPRLVCAWLDCDMRVWKRVRAALVEEHGKLLAYTDANGVAWLVNDRVQKELGGKSYAELTANLSPKFPIANAELSPKSAETPNKNNGSAHSEKPEIAPPIPLPLPKIPPNPQGGGELRLVAEEPKPPPDAVEVAFRRWNETAEACGLAKAKDLTPGRRKAIGKRLEDAGPEGWAEALAAVGRSAFLRGLRPGRDQRAFKADLDFVCQAKTFQRLREGFYGEDAPAPKPSGPTAPPVDPWLFKVRRYATGSRYWNDAEDGPRPGRPDCLAPPEILEQFGFGGEPSVIPFTPAKARA